MKNLHKILNIIMIISCCCIVGCNQEIPTENLSVTTDISIGTSEINVMTTTTLNIELIPTEPTATTEPVILGYQLNNLNSIAEDLYNQACEKYRSVLIDGSYGVDFSNYIVDQSGKKYFIVTNPYYPILESVFEDWHTVFNENYDTLITSSYMMYDDSLYAYTGIQQRNTNYNGTNLTYYSTTGNEVTFKATCGYSSGDKIFKFSIVYYPETDEWRVGKFTMPY